MIPTPLPQLVAAGSPHLIRLGLYVLAGLVISVTAFTGGWFVHKGAVADDLITLNKQVSELNAAKEKAEADLRELRSTIKVAEEQQKKRDDEAKREVDATKAELAKKTSSFQATVRSIQEQARAREASEEKVRSAVEKTGQDTRPRCRGPVLSPGLMDDINRVIQATGEHP